MKLMAEDRGLQTAGGIRELFFERGHLVALCAICRGKGLLAIMTASTGTALIHEIHRYLRSALFHGEQLGMTFAAGIFLCMVLVRENNRHAGSCIGEIRHLMASVTYILVQVGFPVGFYDMTLVAVDTKAHMFCVRKFPGFIDGELLIGMASETWETGLTQ